MVVECSARRVAVVIACGSSCWFIIIITAQLYLYNIQRPYYIILYTIMEYGYRVKSEWRLTARRQHKQLKTIANNERIR